MRKNFDTSFRGDPFFIFLLRNQAFFVSCDVARTGKVKGWFLVVEIDDVAVASGNTGCDFLLDSLSLVSAGISFWVLLYDAGMN